MFWDIDLVYTCRKWRHTSTLSYISDAIYWDLVFKVCIAAALNASSNIRLGFYKISKIPFYSQIFNPFNQLQNYNR